MHIFYEVKKENVCLASVLSINNVKKIRFFRKLPKAIQLKYKKK